MPFQFRLSGSKLFFLIALMVVVAALTFGTGMLYGTILAEREALAQSLEASSSDVEAPAGMPLESAPVDRNGTPQLVYEIQLSSHLRQEETKPIADKLQAAGYRAFVVETRDSSDRSLYTVRIGPWSDFAEAAEAAEAFRNHSGLAGLDPKIRHRPKPAMPGSDVTPPDGSAS